MRCGRGEGVVCEAGEDFLDVAYAYCAAGGGLEVVISGEGEVDAVFKIEPFLVGEEGAEGGVAESDGFVGAKGLCAVERMISKAGQMYSFGRSAKKRYHKTRHTCKRWWYST